MAKLRKKRYRYTFRRYKRISSPVTYIKCNAIYTLKRRNYQSYTFANSDFTEFQQNDPVTYLPLSIVCGSTSSFVNYRSRFTYYMIRGLRVVFYPRSTNNNVYFHNDAWDPNANDFKEWHNTPWDGYVQIMIQNNFNRDNNIDFNGDYDKYLLLNPYKEQARYWRFVDGTWHLMEYGNISGNFGEWHNVPGGIPYVMTFQSVGDLNQGNSIQYPTWIIRFTFYVMFKNAIF